MNCNDLSWQLACSEADIGGMTASHMHMCGM